MLNLKGTFSNGEEAMVVHTWEGKRILGHLVTLCHTRLLVILVIALEGRTSATQVIPGLSGVAVQPHEPPGHTSLSLWGRHESRGGGSCVISSLKQDRKS